MHRIDAPKPISIDHAAPVAAKRIELSAEFRIPAERLFEIVARHEAWPEWFPLLRSIEVDHSASASPGTTGVGTRRLCRLRLIGELDERIVAWDPPRTYRYSVNSPRSPFARHTAELRVVPMDADRATLIWTAWFEHRRWMGVPVAAWCSRAALAVLMRAALRRLRALHNL
jgi:hypothetical protein